MLPSRALEGRPYRAMQVAASGHSHKSALSLNPMLYSQTSIWVTKCIVNEPKNTLLLLGQTLCCPREGHYTIQFTVTLNMTFTIREKSVT